MLDNLFESYRARGDEFALYHLSGMKKSDIARMKFYEILITFAFGIFLGELLMIALSLAINATMMGYGFDPMGSVFLRLF